MLRGLAGADRSALKAKRLSGSSQVALLFTRRSHIQPVSSWTQAGAFAWLSFADFLLLLGTNQVLLAPRKLYTSIMQSVLPERLSATYPSIPWQLERERESLHNVQEPCWIILLAWGKGVECHSNEVRRSVL